MLLPRSVRCHHRRLSVLLPRVPLSRKQEELFSPLFGSRGYLRQSRYLGFGLITLAPLLILYELLAWQAQSGHHAILRNKADVIIKYPIHEFGLPAGWF